MRFKWLHYLDGKKRLREQKRINKDCDINVKCTKLFNWLNSVNMFIDIALLAHRGKYAGDGDVVVAKGVLMVLYWWATNKILSELESTPNSHSNYALRHIWKFSEIVYFLLNNTYRTSTHTTLGENYLQHEEEKLDVSRSNASKIDSFWKSHKTLKPIRPHI